MKAAKHAAAVARGMDDTAWALAVWIDDDDRARQIAHHISSHRWLRVLAQIASIPAAVVVAAIHAPRLAALLLERAAEVRIDSGTAGDFDATETADLDRALEQLLNGGA